MGIVCVLPSHQGNLKLPVNPVQVSIPAGIVLLRKSASQALPAAGVLILCVPLLPPSLPSLLSPSLHSSCLPPSLRSSCLPPSLTHPPTYSLSTYLPSFSLSLPLSFLPFSLPSPSLRPSLPPSLTPTNRSNCPFLFLPTYMYTVAVETGLTRAFLSSPLRMTRAKVHSWTNLCVPTTATRRTYLTFPGPRWGGGEGCMSERACLQLLKAGSCTVSWYRVSSPFDLRITVGPL